MLTIGLLGGMSWESTAQYYRIINTAVRERLGPLRSAEILIYSVDFGAIEPLQREDRWPEAGVLLAQAAQRLYRGGAHFILLCTNTMHRIADQIETATPLDLLHIADPVGSRAQQLGASVVGLLGTRFTMEADFYRHRLEQRYGLTLLIPEEPARMQAHRIIYEELCAGQIKESSRQFYRELVEHLVARGAQAVILGCTEIMLLFDDADSPVPLLDTTTLHALAAVDRALTL